MLVEIFFALSQFQCGANAPMATFAAQYADTPIMEEGDKRYIQFIEDDTENPPMDYNWFLDNLAVVPEFNASCAIDEPVITVLGKDSEVPIVPGLYNQESIEEWHSQLKTPYQFIILYEFGTTNLDSPAADLQDVVILVDFNYQYAD